MLRPRKKEKKKEFQPVDFRDFLFPHCTVLLLLDVKLHSSEYLKGFNSEPRVFRGSSRWKGSSLWSEILMFWSYETTHFTRRTIHYIQTGIASQEMLQLIFSI